MRNIPNTPIYILPLVVLLTSSCTAGEDKSNISLSATSSSYAMPTETNTKMPEIVCPKLDNDYLLLQIAPLMESHNKTYNDAILEYLNNGGSIENLRSQLIALADWFDVEVVDITNDSIPEIVVNANWTYIFGCKKNGYQSILVVEPFDLIYNYSPQVYTNKDLNNNGIPEIIIIKLFGGPYPIQVVEILEWNGNTFANIITKDPICIYHGIETCIKDGVIRIMNGYMKINELENGIMEISIFDGEEMSKDPEKYGNVTPINIILRWNGLFFVVYSIKYYSLE